MNAIIIYVTNVNKRFVTVPELFKDLAICNCKNPGKIESNSLINFKITNNEQNQFNKLVFNLELINLIIL